MNLHITYLRDGVASARAFTIPDHLEPKLRELHALGMTLRLHESDNGVFIVIHDMVQGPYCSAFFTNASNEPRVTEGLCELLQTFNREHALAWQADGSTANGMGSVPAGVTPDKIPMLVQVSGAILSKIMEDISADEALFVLAAALGGLRSVMGVNAEHFEAAVLDSMRTVRKVERGEG